MITYRQWPNGSKENQDKFAFELIGPSGIFLDLGSREPVKFNNTVNLEDAGWTGFLFEIDEQFIRESHKCRSSPAFNIDVTTQKFIDTLRGATDVTKFDYISMDVDDATLDAMKLLLTNDYSFKCMTFEHDAHKDGDEPLRNPSRVLLESYGYVRLFGDVNNAHPGTNWEDWWIDPAQFPTELKARGGSNIHHKDCIASLKRYNEARK